MLRADSVSFSYDVPGRLARRGSRSALPRDAYVPAPAAPLVAYSRGPLHPAHNLAPLAGTPTPRAAPLVLDRVHLSLAHGGRVGILGPNGSGKTTLLRLLAGTLRPLEGRVTLDGAELVKLSRSALARRMAVVPQETQLVFDYTVLEIVLMGRYPHLGPFEVEGPRDVAIARAALEATGTGRLESRVFMTLSGGEKQRVIIASALAQLSGFEEPETRNPKPETRVLLLDEPTASLDLGYQLEIGEIVRRLNRERGVGILVSTHDLNFAASLCRDLVLLRAGRVLAAGPTQEVLTPDSIRELFDVDADVRYHDRAGHLTVVPVGRAHAERPENQATEPQSHGD